MLVPPAAARAALTAAALLVLSAAPAAARAQDRADCPYADAMPGQASAASVRASTLCLLNAERVARGLHPLRAQSTLGQVAAGFAGEMVAERFFDHTSPTGTTPLSRIETTTYLRHARTWLVGENIAWGSDSLGTPRAIVESWMSSPPHRANLLDRRFTDIGIGIAAGAPEALADGQLGATYVTDFGQRRRH